MLNALNSKTFKIDLRRLVATQFSYNLLKNYKMVKWVLFYEYLKKFIQSLYFKNVYFQLQGFCFDLEMIPEYHVLILWNLKYLNGS